MFNEVLMKILCNCRQRCFEYGRIEHLHKNSSSQYHWQETSRSLYISGGKCCGIAKFICFDDITFGIFKLPDLSCPGTILNGCIYNISHTNLLV